MKWSESDTIALVELYEKHECIWNIGSKDYRNKLMRDDVYEDIVKTLKKDNFGVTKLKQKIKNLRCTYNQELLKIKKSQKSGSGVDDLYVPNIKWFKLMDSFMKNVKSVKIGYTQDNAESRVVTTTSAKNRKLHHFTTAITELHDIQNDLNKMDSTEISDNEAFGQYIIAALNKLSPRQVILAQSDIQSLLTKYRLAEQSGSNNFHSTSPQSFYTTDEDTSTQYNIATDQDTSTQYTLLSANTSNEHDEENRDNIIAKAWSLI
ncbi:hypothetical protein QTP88_017191 [Uroleucon formosanum]